MRDSGSAQPRPGERRYKSGSGGSGEAPGQVRGGENHRLRGASGADEVDGGAHSVSGVLQRGGETEDCPA